jgi:hypothetical protein
VSVSPSISAAASSISCSASCSKSKTSSRTPISRSLVSVSGRQSLLVGALKFRCPQERTKPASRCDRLISIPTMVVFRTLSTPSLLQMAVCMRPIWLKARSHPAEFAITLRICIANFASRLRPWSSWVSMPSHTLMGSASRAYASCQC